MRGRLNRILAMVLVLISEMLLFSGAYASKAIPNATSKFVNDFANVISHEAESEMAERAKVLYEAYPEKVQVMVATVESLDGEAINDYALRMYNTYGIGLKDVNQGALILVSINDRKTWITTGAGTDDYYITDDRASELAALGNPYFKNDNFSAGLEAIQIAVIDEFDSKMNVEVSGEYSSVNHFRVEDDLDRNNSVEIASQGEEISASLSQSSANEIQEGIDGQKNLISFRIERILIVILGLLTVIWMCLYAFQLNRASKVNEKLERQIGRKQRYKDELESTKDKYARLKTEVESMKNELSVLNFDFEELHAKYIDLAERFDMAKRIDPQIEAKVAKKIAESWDRRANCILNSSTPYDDKLMQSQNLMREFDGLAEDVKSFVTLAFDLRRHIKNSIDNRDREAAKEVEEQIKRKVERIHKVSASDYSNLSVAKKLYEGLNENARTFVDVSFITGVFSLLHTAERLKKDAEREEQRRRREEELSFASSSDSSYDSSSFDAGDGGSSDGGGGGADW